MNILMEHAVHHHKPTHFLDDADNLSLSSFFPSPLSSGAVVAVFLTVGADVVGGSIFLAAVAVAVGVEDAVDAAPPVAARSFDMRLLKKLAKTWCSFWPGDLVPVSEPNNSYTMLRVIHPSPCPSNRPLTSFELFLRSLPTLALLADLVSNGEPDAAAPAVLLASSSVASVPLGDTGEGAVTK